MFLRGMLLWSTFYLLMGFMAPLAGNSISGNIQFTGIADGLSHNMINSFHEDSQGFIWISTEQGLNRFNGYEFKVFHPEINYNPIEEHLTIVFEDHDLNLWLQSNQSLLVKFDIRKEKYTTYQLSGSASIADAFIRTSYNPIINLIVAASNSGLYYFKNETDSFEKIAWPAAQSPVVNALMVDSLGHIWVGTANEGLWVFDSDFEKWYFYKTNPADTSTLSMNTVLSVSTDYHDNIWVGTMWGINRVIFPDNNHLSALSFQRIIPHSYNNSYNFINHITPHPEGDIWITTNQGVLRMIPEQNDSIIFEFFLDDIPDPERSSLFFQSPLLDSQNRVYLLTNSTTQGIHCYDYDKGSISEVDISFQALLDAEKQFSLRTFFIDSNDVLWVALEKNGFLRYNLNQQPFHTLLGGKDTYGILRLDDNTLLVGSRLGINILSPESNDWKLISPSTHPQMKWKFAGTLRPLDSTHVWVGFWDGLASIFSLPDTTFRHFDYNHLDSSSLRTWSVRDIYSDNAGNTWITGANSGPAVMKNTNGQFRYFQSETNTSRAIPASWISSVYEDERRIWFGSREMGLISLDKSDSIFTSHRALNSRNEYWANEVSQIYPYENYLWLATTLDGLVRFNPTSNQFTSFGLENGFPSDAIKSIVGDENGNLWVGTNQGLVRFNTKTGQVNAFFTNDGLPSDEFNSNSSWKDKDGIIYMGTTKGLLRFDPDEITISPDLPPSMITALHIYNSPVAIDSVYDNIKILQQSITQTDTIRLSWKHKMISLEFASLNYSQPGNVRYFYQLRGFDDQWHETPAESRVATFTNLKPGHYDFNIRIINSNGVPSDVLKTLHIYVLTPWFETLLFRIALFMAITGLIILLFVLRTKQLRQQKIQLEKLVENRTKQLREANQELTSQKEYISDQNQQLEKQSVQLKEADYLKTRFFVNISHELRTPLTLIMLPLDSLESKINKPGQLKLIRLIRRNSNRLLQLIDQLLDIRKIETGNTKVKLSPTDVGELLTSISDLFVKAAREKRIRLQRDLSSVSGSEIWLDQDIFSKIVYNLLSNAVKYTPRGEFIAIEAKLEGNNHLIFQITNTGIGITEEQKKDVFKRFYHYDSKKENIGYGIGLSYVQDLVALYNGTIKADSVPNEYTIFTVTLPVKPDAIPGCEMNENDTNARLLSEEYTTENKAISKELVKWKNAPPSILIIEDNQELLEYLEGELETMFNVSIASDGNAGLQVATQKIPDLIITDIEMPGMSGTELVNSVKNNILTSHIPIIMLTAHSTQQDQIEGLLSGADDYVTKPFNLELLKARIITLLNNRKRISGNILDPERKVVPGLSDLDQEFLNKCNHLIKNNIFNNQYNYEAFFADLGMSRSNCYRKMKGLAGKSPGEYILAERMRIASEYLTSGQWQPTQLAHEMGYNTPANFTRDFKKVFKVTPSSLSKK